MKSSDKCFSCSNGALRREVKDEVYTYKGHSITVKQPGMYCDYCGESFLSNEDLKITRKAIHDLHALGDDFLTSAEVKRIREKIGFTQKKAGDFFGGGVNAFSRYERGEARQSKSIDRLLRMYDSNPELLLGNSSGTDVTKGRNWVMKKKSHIQICRSSTHTAIQSRKCSRLVGRSISTECEQPLMVVNG